MNEIREILETAMKTEDDYYQLFSSCAQKAEEQTIKKLFNELAQEGLEHKEKLKTVLSEKIDKYNTAAAETLKKSDFLSQIALNDDLPPEKILSLAILKKKEAYGFYSQIAKIAPTQKLKSFYHNLANIELALNMRLESINI